MTAQPDTTLSAADAAFLVELRRNSAPESAPVRRAPLAAFTCNGAGGLWSAPATWSPAGPPTNADDVTISAGCTVTVDTPAAALSLTVQNGGVVVYDAAIASTLTVGSAVTIDAGGSINAPASGIVTTHVLSVGGNLLNNGTLDLSTNANTAAAGLVFTNPGSNSFSGAGATTDVRTLTINKGTSSANVLELSTTNFTVQGASVDSPTMAFLTLTNGTLKVSGAFTFAGRFFAGVAAYSIPATGGFWLNNANVTVSGQAGSPTNSGVLRLSSGIYNVGTGAGNSMGAGNGAIFVIEGGTLNVAGRLNSGSTFITYTQSAGNVNVATVGNAAGTPSFGFTSFTGSVMNFSGGSINLVQASTAATPLDYANGGTMNFTGGTLNVGTAATLTNFLFRVQGQMPNVVIDNTGTSKNVNLSGQGNVWGNLTINPGSTLNLNAFVLLMIGPTINNNGAIAVITNNSSAVAFGGTLQTVGAPYTQTYAGAGTFGTAALRVGTINIQNQLGVVFDPAVSNLNLYRINALFGPITNANKLANGAGDAIAVVIQRGVNGIFPASTFDVAPTFNIGAGGLSLIYNQSSTPVTTGPEVPVARSILSLSIGNATGVTLAGGPLSLTATGVLTLNSGTLTTSNTNLLTLTNTAAGGIVGGTGTSFVSGPLARTLPASLVAGSTYTFPLGKNSFKMLELFSPTTNAGGTVVVQAEVFDSNSGGTAGAGLSALNSNRYWSAEITSGAANFTDATVRLTEAGTPAVSAIARSATLAGIYDSIGGLVTPPTIGPSNTVTALGFFAVGTLTGATPICGNFNVGTAGDFATLTAAVTALNSRPMSCAVTFTLTDNVYAGETYPIQINANAGSSVVNTLTIKPAAAATPVFTGSAATALILLNGADYVTIDGSNTLGGTSRDLTFANTNVSVTSAVIWGQTVAANDPASNNTLKNLVVSGNADITTLVGIGFGSSIISTASLGTRNDNNRVQNNRITAAQFGIVSQGASTNIKNIGTVITRNELGGSGTSALGRAGIFVGFDDGVQIISNLINGVSGLIPNVDTFGIAVGSILISNTAFTTNNDVANAVITGNVVGPVTKTDTFSAAGISLATTLYGTSRIANNFVHSVRANGTASDFCVGIYIGNAGSNNAPTEVYHNSVSITGDRDTGAGGPTSQPAFALAILGANPLVDLRNNSLANTSTAPTNGLTTAGSYAIGISSTLPLTKFTSNYNDLFSSGAASHFSMVGSLVNILGDRTSLAAWQAATGKDANSISVDPLYTSATDLHLQLASPLGNAGTPIAGVTVDIDGDTRSLSAPEIGADEFPNTAPGITPTAGGITRQQDSGTSNSQIAVVTDAETAVGSLVVTTQTVPAGISVNNIVNTGGTITANVAASCSAATGANLVGLRVTDGGNSSTDADLTVNVNVNTAPVLGVYPASGATTGAGTTVTPNAVPTDNGTISTITAAAPSFTGSFLVNPVSGIVTVSNAGPAGVYVVTVTATDACGAPTTATFQLTVSNSNSAPTVTAGAALNRQAGSAGGVSPLATVTDNESLPASIVVTAQTVPAGISVTGITNTAGAITGNVAAACSATVGANTVVLRGTDPGLLFDDENLTVNVSANTAPTLGTYGNALINLNASTTLTPTAAPSDTGSVASVTAAAPGFTGSFSVNPGTGVVTITNAAPGGTYTVTVTATDNCGLTSTRTFQLTVNTAPVLTAATAITRQQGSATSVSPLATVTDAQSAASTIPVVAQSVPAGLSVTGITNASGAISGSVAASCSATLGSNTVVLRASDNGGLFDDENFTVNVTANGLPTVSYNAGFVLAGTGALLNPSTAPADNGSVTNVAVFSSGTYTGGVSVAANGVITLTNAAPEGQHTLTIRLTDNCGVTNDIMLGVTVVGEAIFADGFEDVVRAPAVVVLPLPTDGKALSLALPMWELQELARQQDGVAAIEFVIGNKRYLLEVRQSGGRREARLIGSQHAAGWMDINQRNGLMLEWQAQDVDGAARIDASLRAGR